MATLGEASMSGVPALGLPKIKSFVGCCFATVIHEDEEHDALGFKNALELFNGGVYRMTAPNIDDPICAHLRLHAPTDFSLRCCRQFTAHS